ncbi:hypothetical protein NDU88_002305 [Pleurodeles waltl]|uniref:Uncharacterized protein n=1 Tax=Pleurodeles waltl TaxID=8319 RepID=A0AAV7UCS6_PLEWA|nr:hypothetical protein NDU88_002305 [Pleurodeles waltl]
MQETPCFARESTLERECAPAPSSPGRRDPRCRATPTATNPGKEHAQRRKGKHNAQAPGPTQGAASSTPCRLCRRPNRDEGSPKSLGARSPPTLPRDRLPFAASPLLQPHTKTDWQRSCCLTKLCQGTLLPHTSRHRCFLRRIGAKAAEEAAIQEALRSPRSPLVSPTFRLSAAIPPGTRSAGKHPCRAATSQVGLVDPWCHTDRIGEGKAQMSARCQLQRPEECFL